MQKGGMSKAKKGGKAQPDSIVWDEALVNEITDDVSISYIVV